MINLPVEKRTEPNTGALRRSGKVPGVVYGAHHESTPIMIDAIAFTKAWGEAGEATVVSLTGLGEAVPTLIHEVDLDPLTSQPQHVDFYAVTKGEKVQVHVPIEFIGESAAVKAGANLVKVLHEIEVEADPMKLPHDLKVDLSALVNLNDQIHVRDIALPEGVALVTGEDEVIVIAQEVTQEKEEEVTADISSVEVEKKGKEEETEEAASSEAA
jgi:large subunit ribosomal protein L25